MSDLENYKFQRDQVKEALEQDPENEELIKLLKDLEELIDLYSQIPTTQPKEQKEPAKPKSYKTFEIGDIVLAKWSDGQFYEALVVGVKEENEYEVVFTGYESIEILNAGNIREPKPDQKRPTLLSSNQVIVGDAAKLQTKLQMKLNSKEKRKNKRKEENRAENVKDSERVANWKQFQSKIKKVHKK